MLPALKSALKSLELDEKQVAVLGALLETGAPMLVSVIARDAKLNRTTAYDILKELGEKGLVSRIEKKGVLRFAAIAPELLPAYVERRREALEESKKQIAHIIPQIKLLQAHGASLPKVQFFEGIEGVKQAYEDTLENNKSKMLYSLTGTDALYRALDEEWMEYYWQKRVQLGIRCIVLAPDTEWSVPVKARDKELNRETKLIPEGYSFDSEIDIYDNKIGVFTYRKEHPIAIIIEDETIHDTMQTFFDFMSAQAH